MGCEGRRSSNNSQSKSRMDSEKPQEKKPIPKFASFKPKPAPQRESLSPAYREAETRSGRSEKSKDRSKSLKASDESRPRRRSRDRRSHRSRHSRDSNHRSQFEGSREEGASIIKDESRDSNLFIEDRKGDRYNVIYGTLHRYSVPLYYREGRGSVLGLLNSYKIDRNVSDGTSVVVNGRLETGDSTRQRKKNKSLLSKWNDRGSKVIRIRPDAEHDGSVGAQKNFLPLDSNGGRKRRRLQERSPFGDEQGDYRSIGLVARPDPDLSSDLEEVSDSDLRQGNEVDLDDNEEAKIRQVELSKQVQEHPDDPDAWLQLIDHQDALIATVGGDRKRKFTTAETQSVADIKVSMYEKALAKLKTDTLRDNLLLGMLEEGSKIWDTKKLSKKWRDVLNQYPQYISLWTKYLDFQQTQFVEFTYDQCRSIFTNCLETIRGSDLGDLENVNITLYLLLRMTVLMREAGFTELAVGLWQAILEFILFTPQEFKTSRHSPAARSSFAEFWESEVARIGEIGAKGWKASSSNAMEPKVDISKGRVNTESLFESWVSCERARELNTRLPARTLDEVDEDDPYRVILFSDIEEFLIPFSSTVAAGLLINSFLTFCLLPPLISDDSAEFVGEWRGDPFLRNDLMDRSDAHKWLPNLYGGPETSNDAPWRILPLQNFISTTDTLFGDGDSWYSSLEVWKTSYLDNPGPIDPNWVRRALRNLVNQDPKNENLSEYTLAIELASNSKEAKKYGKSLLKKLPTSLRLYNAYALVESRNGNSSAAEHVWTTALSMSKGFAEEDRIDRIILWKSWLWELVNKHDYIKATCLLLAMPDLEKDPAVLLESNSDASGFVSPAEFLKFQRFTRETQDYALSLRKVITFVNITECLALLFYIAKSSDIYSALEVFRDADRHLTATLQASNRSVSFFREILHQAKTRLLHHHIKSTKKYKPATIRDDLEGSIKLFPQNTIFLTLFAQNETARFLRVDDRVRALTRNLLSMSQKGSFTTGSIIPHFFSVFSELQRGAAASKAELSTATTKSMPTASANAVRAAFEGTFDTRAGQSSAALWKLYVLFEISQGRATLARHVFYRGVRACPWAKALVMVAFTHLRETGVMDFNELRKVYNVLVEKELRIHVDLEDTLEEHDMAAERDAVGTNRTEHNPRPISMPDDASGDEDD